MKDLQGHDCSCPENRAFRENKGALLVGPDAGTHEVLRMYSLRIERLYSIQSA